MKNIITLILLLFAYALSFSQSANLDREYFNVSYVKLPTHPILDNSKRTFSTNKRAISLSGFSRVKSNGTLDINYRFNGTNVGEVEIKKTKHEKKDDDGNVVSTSYTYKVHVTYTSSASIAVSNSENIENDYQNDFSEKDNYESKNFSTYSAAQNYYNNNRNNLRNTHSSDHQKGILYSINANLNNIYGYQITNSRSEHFWILGKKKHPEYKKHMEAFETMKAVFSKMKSDESVANLKNELTPVIDYFNSLVPKYAGQKKKETKMRYASFYNIAKMYYYLDMPEKSKIYAQKLIDNGYDKSDGKYFIRKADELITKFKANNTNTRHFEVLTEDLSNIVEEPIIVETEESSSLDLELIKAYLVSKAGDTTLVDVDTKDIKNIAYKMNIVRYADNGTPIGTEVKSAKALNEVLFIDGTHYKNVNFKETTTNQETLNGSQEKLCKVLVESNNINLYLFNEEEPVIVTSNNETGISTLSKSYVFGFNKNLAKLAEGHPVLIEKVNNNQFKNTIEDLVKFCNELASLN
ncbi:hypothetical protein HNV10_01395 [Winogradskyella litoriviva]|uniref:Uncharacterized protein n=1 Tax=Winogradskyella litoriviva TaxID=1220182 RepID=A0ABX2E029_9FLAO|nr:hypothetical protein [Winogradskyella litoriviva]NRD21875.1 hypothetical protein [Winogradskyella litoriviva]